MESAIANGRTLLKLLSIFLVAGILFISSAEPARANNDGVFALAHENDLFASQDQYYTSGAQMTWFSPDQDVPDFLENIADEFDVYSADAEHRVSYSLGQNMFTPRDITDPTPPEDERPYAGWLYGSVGLIQDRGDRLDSLELTLGVVGPSARAKETQQEIHDLVGAPDPEGWETQLHDELGVQVRYGQRNVAWTRRMLLGYTFEVMPGYSLSVGNVKTGAEVSTMFRWGDLKNRDYGPPLIRSGMPGSGYFKSGEQFEWYLYSNLSGEYVAHNIFLDGNTIRDSRSVEKEPFVGELQTGLVLTWTEYRLSYTHVFPTKEFETQSNTDDYGAITLSTRF